MSQEHACGVENCPKPKSNSLSALEKHMREQHRLSFCKVQMPMPCTTALECTVYLLFHVVRTKWNMTRFFCLYRQSLRVNLCVYPQGLMDSLQYKNTSSQTSEDLSKRPNIILRRSSTCNAIRVALFLTVLFLIFSICIRPGLLCV